jgi:hypothetical protein
MQVPECPCGHYEHPYVIPAGGGAGTATHLGPGSPGYPIGSLIDELLHCRVPDKTPFRRREAVGRAPGWTRATARVAVSWVVGAWSAHEDPGRSQGRRTAARRHWRQLPSLLREPCGVDRYRAWLRPNTAGVKMGERGGLGIHVRA